MRALQTHTTLPTTMVTHVLVRHHVSVCMAAAMPSIYSLPPYGLAEIQMLLPNNQRQHRTLHIQKDVLPYSLCWLLCPFSAALASIFRVDSISTSYNRPCNTNADTSTTTRVYPLGGQEGSPCPFRMRGQKEDVRPWAIYARTSPPRVDVGTTAQGGAEPLRRGAHNLPASAQAG